MDHSQEMAELEVHSLNAAEDTVRVEVRYIHFATVEDILVVESCQSMAVSGEGSLTISLMLRRRLPPLALLLA
jgi:hypothetical protein